MRIHVEPRSPSEELAGTTARLLATVPDWFAHEEENRDYIDAARRLPGHVALLDGVAVGVLLEKRHFPQASEIYLLAVDGTRHRSGAGRALVTATEQRLRAERCGFLQVKTLGPSHSDPGYVSTRAFYSALGFTPMEETCALWEHDQPCLFMIKHLG